MDLSKLTTIKAELVATQERLNEEFKESIKKVFQDFFKEYPEVYCFAWTQYTPYFNDGDECVFSVNELSAFTEEVKKTLEEERSSVFWGDGEGLINGYSYGKGSKETQSAVEGFLYALTSFENEFRFAFGDHVSVLVTREGIEVDEYEHD